MPTTRKMIRVPVELADRLVSLAAEMERAHVEGRSQLPNEFVERIPLHHVIDRAVSDWTAHKARSRAPKRSKVGS